MYIELQSFIIEMQNKVDKQPHSQDADDQTDCNLSHKVPIVPILRQPVGCEPHLLLSTLACLLARTQNRVVIAGAASRGGRQYFGTYGGRFATIWGATVSVSKIFHVDIQASVDTLLAPSALNIL